MNSKSKFQSLATLWLGVAAITFSGPTFAAADGATNAPVTTAPASKPSVKADDLFPDPVIARGKGVEIKRSQLDEALIAVKSNLPVGQNLPPSDVTERQLLERLIQIQLLVSRATAADKAKAKERFDRDLQSLKSNAKVSNEEFDVKLNRELRAQGLTREQWERQRLELATRAAVLERELNVDVSDADVKKYYEENPARFEQPEMVRAAHILLRTRDDTTGADYSDEQKKAKRKQIEDILKRARDGEDFAKLAKEFSEDPGSKDRGGEYTFPRGRMVAEFEAAAFSLKTNQISDVVTTVFGYHIIKVYEKIPASKVELARVADDIKQFLKGQEMQKQMPAYVEKLSRDAGVEILDGRLKSKETPKAPAAEPAKSDKKDSAPPPVKK